MRTVVDYLQKACEFDELAERSKEPALKKRYADVADCYRLLADERAKLIGTGVVVNDEIARH